MITVKEVVERAYFIKGEEKDERDRLTLELFREVLEVIDQGAQDSRILAQVVRNI